MSAAQSPPRLEPNCDVRKLPISPTEAFVLSRIDGTSGVVELSNATGLPESTIAEALEHLRVVGAIRYGAPLPSGGGAATQSGPARAEPASGGSPGAEGKAARARVSGVERVVRYDRSLLEEEVDIPLELRMDLLDLYFSIDVVNHYDLLGVAEDADRKAVKQAYFDRVNVLHPDRFFGKNIGSYKARIERVFTALTKAHDTLTKRQSRAEYDAYLESRQETVGLRSSRLPTPPSEPPRDQGSAIPAAARAPFAADEILAGASDEVEPGRTSDVELRQDAAGGAGPLRVSPSTGTGIDDAARRQMARKLKGASQPPPAADPQPEGDLEEARRALEANLRARYEARLKDPAATNRFMAMAAEAERSQSWASAVNALKAALELTPEDPKIQTELARVELLADRAYAGKFVEQARYEESDGQYERAARSYERAARGRGSAELYSHAALCQLRAAGGGRRAVELARKGVALGPTHIGARLALARAYFQEGMTASALAEVVRALEIDPKHEEARRLQGEFKKSSSS